MWLSICSQLDPVPAPAFLRAVEVACQGLSDADVTQAVLEVLAVPGSGVSASDPPALIRALFSHLDVSGEVRGGLRLCECFVLSKSPGCQGY